MYELIETINNLELWEALLFGFTVAIIIRAVYQYGYCKNSI